MHIVLPVILRGMRTCEMPSMDPELFGDLDWFAHPPQLGHSSSMAVSFWLGLLSSVPSLVFIITCWTLSGPEETIFSWSPGTQFLTHHGHPVLPMCPSNICYCLESVWLLSQESPVSDFDCIFTLHVDCLGQWGTHQRSGMSHVSCPFIRLPLCTALALGLFWNG